MKSSVLIALVIGIHVLAIGGVIVMQGCETRRPTVEPPSPPVLPPRPEVGVAPVPQPVFRPPAPVELAPAVAEPAAGRIYEVQSGDSLSKIASRFGVSTRELVELNNIKDPNRIRVGQKIVLPEYARSQPEPLKPKPAAKALAAEGQQIYVVQPGDSLSKIASRHGTTVSALREANNLSGDKILVGQKLVVPAAKVEAKPKKEEAVPAPKPPEPAAAPPTAVAPVPPPGVEPTLATEEPPMEYVVQEGDTVESVARMYVVRKDALMKLNNLTEGQVLKPGQRLKIPAMY